MSDRQRSETLMSPTKLRDTRRRSGASQGLGIPSMGFRQTFHGRSLTAADLKEFKEDAIQEDESEESTANSNTLTSSLTSSQMNRNVNVAEHALGNRSGIHMRNASQFVDAGVELSDSDYSFTSDNEGQNEDISASIASKIIHKQLENKLDSLKEDKEVLEIYHECKGYTKDYMGERHSIKSSSGKLHINMDMLDLLPKEHKLKYDKFTTIEPEEFWSKVESDFGEPNCFGVNSTGTKIAIGTKTSKVILFDRHSKEFKQINYNSVQSPVTCLDFEDEKKMIFAGYQSGAIVVFKLFEDATHSEFRRHIKVVDASNAPVTHIRQVNDMKNMLITDKESRILYGVKVGKKATDKFTFSEVFMGNRDGFSVLEVFEIFNKTIVILASGAKASIFVLKNSKTEPLMKVAEIGAPRGQKKSYESFPILSCVKYQKKVNIYILSMVWGYHISSYIVRPEKNSEIEIDLKDNLDFSDRIIYASNFDNHNICLVSQKGEISLYNIQNHLESKRKKEVKEEKRRRGTMAFNAAMMKRMKEKEKEEEEEAKMNIPAPPTLKMRAGTMMLDIPDYKKMRGKRKGSGLTNDTDVSEKSEQPKTARQLLKGATSDMLKEAVTSKYVTKTKFKVQREEVEYFDKKPFSERERPNSVFFRCFELKNWIQFLNECIQKECFIFGLKCINEILDMGDINLREIPPNYNDMMTDLSPILLLFITKIFPAMAEKTEYVNLMANLSMFILLKAGMGEYIATQLQAVMEAFGFEDQYLNNLRIFYEGSLIYELPQEKIEKIVEKLNSKPIKRNQFLSFIYHRKKQFKNFVIEYTKTHPETFYLYIIFITKENPENSSLPLKHLYEQLKTQIQQENKEEAKIIVTKMVWYIYEMALRSEKKYGNITSKDQSFHVFKTFFNDEIIKDVINTNTIHFLNCFKFLLAKDLATQLSRITEPLKEIKLREKEDKILDEAKSNQYILYLFDKFDEYVEESHRFQFNFFLCNLILKPVENVQISGDFIKSLFTQVIDKFHDFVEDKEIDLEEDDVVMLLFSIFTNHRHLFEGDAKIFNSLKEKSKKLMLIQYEMKKNQKATFALFQRLVTDNEEYKKELFNWLANGLKRPEDKQRMLKVVDEEYIYLIKKDHKRFARLLESLTIEEQMDYIMKYKPTTKSKLEIFKRILAFVKKKHMENEITNEFKVEYINLLNKHEKPKVLPELMTGKYPSSECLQTCIDARNHLAIAYIKERLGYYGEALDIYKKRLKKVLKSLSRGGRYDIPHRKERMLGRLHKESQMALDLCRDAEGSEKFIVQTTAKYKKRRIPEWVKVSEKILDYILSTVPSKNFIAKIEDPEYPFVRDEHLMERTVNHFKSLKGIFSATKRVNASDWWDSNNGLMENLIVGKECKVVDDPDTVGDSALIFKNCPHTFEVCKTEWKGQPIYCDVCERDFEAARALYRIIRFWRREKFAFRPKDLVTQKRMLLHEIFKGLKLKSKGKQKVYLDKYDKEKKKIEDFVNYMSSEAGFSEIDTGASIIA